ncbi:ATP-dependent nuclease [Tepidicaulis sp. LMO-SS28]|uniref:ATP-dependent nuclease n=1 Tax=Tepidicaulis sp. LMO-SS28 TaxID=3447455 RepID=UPI003EE2CDD7
MIELEGGITVDGYDRINVILGKNGSGKSTLLRLMDKELSPKGCVRYVTPERGGQLVLDGNLETNRSNNPNWLSQQRRKNQFMQFKESTVSEFRDLETLVLRAIEGDPHMRASTFTFDTEIRKINELLDRVELRRPERAGFELVRKDIGEAAQSSELSSGEAELVSIAVEVLYFSYLCKQAAYQSTDNWLLLDEPDVHLHPDLQHRLMRLLVNSLKEVNGRVAIATHSTPILSRSC